MQEVFENIIKKLEEKAKYHMDFSKIEKIRKEIRIGHLEQYQCFITAIEIVRQAAEEFAHDTNVGNNGWIPCSKRLPERNKPVLCWVRSTTIASGETYIIGSCDNGFWFLQTYEIGHHHFPVKDYEVVAWQPLPEPYQQKGE